MEELKRIEISKEDQMRAAYALNLCTVSVSQIIDYDDIYILEQEYDAILNNLNLERMPKDESLLTILQELLNTITFFRIQEGDKTMLQKEYQHKMKNAIWNSAPNFGMIVATPNPWAIAATLVAEVGIGYMNYRRAKAENDLEREKQEWQLQRSAIEQFNGLRRELFDTAWRLAAEYNFPDNYRLTERQIKQYNQILMDPDDMRRYERLDSIKDNFQAYPPFWYFIGNAANLVAKKEKEYHQNMYQKYVQLTKMYFERFLEASRENLLREDTLVASCALEYIEILDFMEDRDKIYGLLDTAIAASGNECDILQLCAVQYLRLGARKNAADLLLKLVNEDYNTIINSQVLSNIYAYEYVTTKDSDERDEYHFRYEILEQRVDEPQYLFPFPGEIEENPEEAQNKFLTSQKDMLREKYKQVIIQFVKKEAIVLNKLLPDVDDTREYPDTYYLSSKEAKQERLEELEILFANEHRKKEYISKLQDANLTLGVLDILNDIMNGWSDLDCVSLDDEALISSCITGNILKKKNFWASFQNKVSQGAVEYSDMRRLFEEMDLMDYIREGVNEVYASFKTFIDGLKNMSDLNMTEESLRAFCRKHGLAEPVELYARMNRKQGILLPDKQYFGANLLGSQTVQLQRSSLRVKEMIGCIQGAKDSIIQAKEHVALLVKGDVDFNRYVESKGSKFDRAHLLAVIDDKKLGGVLGKDLLFYVNGISQERAKTITKYSHILPKDGNSKLIIGGSVYENKDLDIDALYRTIQKLAEYAKQIEMESDEVSASIVEPARMNILKLRK